MKDRERESRGREKEKRLGGGEEGRRERERVWAPEGLLLPSTSFPQVDMPSDIIF